MTISGKGCAPVPEGYKTIAEYAEAEFEERRSRFIGQLAPVRSEAQALAFLEDIRRRRREATHNVYAYILRENNTTRFSDDGEPSGTAGRPVLEVLQREALVDVAVVVTRYFGGILLGAGGLVRAYAQGSALAVRAARCVEMKPAVELSLALDYTLYGRVEHILPDYGAVDVRPEFSEVVTLRLVLEVAKAQGFTRAVSELSAGRSLPVVERELYFPF